MKDSTTVVTDDAPRSPDPAPRLHATFTRSASRRDRVEVTLADGTTHRWNWATQGDQLPHDAVHLVVESVLRLPSAFWGMVSAGVDVAARAAAHDADPDTMGLPEPARLQFAQAEAACGLLVRTRSTPPPTATAVALLEAACSRLRVPLPAAASPESLDRARHLLAVLGERWAALGDEEGMTVPFPLPAPARPPARPAPVPAATQAAAPAPR